MFTFCDALFCSSVLWISGVILKSLSSRDLAVFTREVFVGILYYGSLTSSWSESELWRNFINDTTWRWRLSVIIVTKESGITIPMLSSYFRSSNANLIAPSAERRVASRLPTASEHRRTGLRAENMFLGAQSRIL